MTILLRSETEGYGVEARRLRQTALLFASPRKDYQLTVRVAKPPGFDPISPGLLTGVKPQIMKKLLYILTFFILFAFEEPTSHAPLLAGINTTINNDATYLTEQVFIAGGCFDVANATTSGGFGAIGTFSNGQSSIGIEEGLILSTGSVLNAHGPNTSTNFTTNFNNTTPDPDLAQMIDNPLIPIQDVAVLEFDFTPTASQVSFKYVFASEEYCDFVNTLYNDAFGFFISGPGIDGPFSNNAINIARVPGSADFVAINNINHLTNSTFYVDNIPQNDGQVTSCPGGYPNVPGAATDGCEYDGFTTVLTASANVIPCQTYHIKLVIGDVTDGQFDSAVFLKANSFTAGETVTAEAFSPTTNANLTYEGCSDAYFEFERFGSALTQPLAVSFNISTASSAEEGMDYAPVPQTVTFGPNESSVQLPITIFADQLNEESESLILELQSACSCNSTLTELIIEDAQPLNITLEDQSQCENTAIVLHPEITGGTPPLQFQWNDGTTTDSLIVDQVGNNSHILMVIDACGQSVTDTVEVNMDMAPSAELTGAANFCNDQLFGELEVELEHGDHWELIYSIDDVLQPPIITTEDQITLPVSTPGSYRLEAISTDMCEGQVAGEAMVSSTNLSIVSEAIDIQCNGMQNGAIDLTVMGGQAPYHYLWDPVVENPMGPSGLGAGNYALTVTDANGCEGYLNITITEPAPVMITANTSSPTCHEIADGQILLAATGGAGNHQYSLDGTNYSGNPLFENLAAGQYLLYARDQQDCITTIETTLNAPLPLTGEVQTTSVSCAGKNDGRLEIIATGGTNELTYSLDGINFQNNPIFTALPAGNQTVIIKDENNCQVTLEAIIASPDPLSIEAYPTHPSCPSSQDGAIEALATGGTGNIQYSLNGIVFQDASTFSHLSADNYTIWARDANNCTIQVEITLVAPGDFSFQIETESPNCLQANGRMEVFTDSGSTYQYSLDGINFQDQSSFQGLSPGPYTVFVRNQQLCVVDTTVFLENATTDYSMDYTIVQPTCANTTNGSIQVEVFGNSTAFQYRLGEQPPQNSNLFSGLAAGTHLISVIDDLGCETYHEVELVSPTPLVATSEIKLQGCQTGEHIITIEVTGGTPSYSYSLDNQAFQVGHFFTGVLPGSHQVNIRDANQCVVILSINIPEINTIHVNILGDSLICAGDTTLLEVVDTFSTYQWNTGAVAPEIRAIPGSYAVTVTNENGCEGVDSITVVENTPFSPSILGSTTFCPGGQTTLSSHEEYQSYLWSTGHQENQVTVNSPGDYGLTVTNANGCSGSSQITINQSDSLSPTITGPAFLCPGDTALLEVQEQFSSYHWQDHSNTNQLWIHEPGIYTVTVADDYGCSGTGSIVVASGNLPEFEIAGPVSFCQGDTVVLVGPPEYPDYSWSNGDQSQETTITEGNHYSLTVTDTDDCSNSDTLSITMYESSTTHLYYQICQGEEIQINNIPYDSGGIFHDTLQTSRGCDSVLVIDIDVTPVFETQNQVQLCQSDSIFLAGDWQHQAGLYQDTLHSTNGCDSIIQTQLTFLPCEFDLEVQGTAPTCYNGTDGSLSISIENGVPPYQITVFDILANPVMMQSLPVDTVWHINDIRSGQYHISVSSAVEGVPAQWDSIFIENPSPIQVDLVELQHETCVGANDGAISIHINNDFPPFLIEWTNGENGTAIDQLPPGSYGVSVINSIGCEFFQHYAIIAPMPLSGEATVVTPFCPKTQSGTIEVQNSSGGSPPYLYSLDGFTFHTSPKLDAKHTGTYTPWIQDASGCEYQFEPVVMEEISGNIEADAVQIKQGDTTSLILQTNFPPAQISWSPSENLSCSNCLAPTAFPTKSTTFYVTAKDSSGCYIEDHISILVDQKSQIYIPSAFSPNGDQVNDVFTLYLGENIASVKSLQIFDRWGNQVYSFENTEDGGPVPAWDGRFKNHLLDPGVFVYQVEVKLINGRYQLFKGDLLLVR